MTVDPGPTFHDLRHSFVANARRSGVAHEVAQSIVGRKNLMKSVSKRYGRISNEVLVQAIDRVSFDHGPTEIMVTRSRKDKADKGSSPVSAQMSAKCEHSALHSIGRSSEVVDVLAGATKLELTTFGLTGAQSAT